MPTPPHVRLRAWSEADFPVWDAIHQDAGMVRWLGGPMSAEARRASFERQVTGLAERGWGVWAVLDADGEVAGAAGLAPIGPSLPFEGVEALWRLRSDASGKGLVSGVMPAVLADGFDRLPVNEILAFTARSNTRSQAVMRRLGFSRDEARDFDHPGLAEDHPLRPHVMYSMARPQEGVVP